MNTEQGWQGGGERNKREVRGETPTARRHSKSWGGGKHCKCREDKLSQCAECPSDASEQKLQNPDSKSLNP